MLGQLLCKLEKTEKRCTGWHQRLPTVPTTPAVARLLPFAQKEPHFRPDRRPRLGQVLKKLMFFCISVWYVPALYVVLLGNNVVLKKDIRGVKLERTPARF